MLPLNKNAGRPGHSPREGDCGRPCTFRRQQMADWRKLAMEAFLADGKIDETEVKILRKELWADGQIDRDEVKFLIDLRNTAQKKARGEDLHPAFEKLFFKAIEDNVLADGKISGKEAG